MEILRLCRVGLSGRAEPVRLAAPHYADAAVQIAKKRSQNSTQTHMVFPVFVGDVALYRVILVPSVLLLAMCSARAETGLASYYGGRGHSGEMTCAHRTKPFGSVVTVTHEGHTIQCRVNDRGPFVRGRIIDVSMSAARALGMMRSGVVRVSIQ